MQKFQNWKELHRFVSFCPKIDVGRKSRPVTGIRISCNSTLLFHNTATVTNSRISRTCTAKNSKANTLLITDIFTDCTQNYNGWQRAMLNVVVYGQDRIINNCAISNLAELDCDRCVTAHKGDDTSSQPPLRPTVIFPAFEIRVRDVQADRMPFLFSPSFLPSLHLPNYFLPDPYYFLLSPSPETSAKRWHHLRCPIFANCNSALLKRFLWYE